MGKENYRFMLDYVTTMEAIARLSSIDEVWTRSVVYEDLC